MRFRRDTQLLAIIFCISLPSVAADIHAGHAATGATTAGADAAMSEGTVRAVDSAKVTLAHGPLANLGMPAMTMKFALKDAAWSARLKTGDRIRFVAESVDGELTVVKFAAVK